MEVTIYTTPMCGFCKTEAKWLDSLGIKYQMKDVQTDAAAAKELDSLLPGHTAVPVTVIDGTIIRGFDRPKLEAALNV